MNFYAYDWGNLLSIYVEGQCYLQKFLQQFTVDLHEWCINVLLFLLNLELKSLIMYFRIISFEVER